MCSMGFDAFGSADSQISELFSSQTATIKAPQHSRTQALVIWVNASELDNLEQRNFCSFQMKVSGYTPGFSSKRHTQVYSLEVSPPRLKASGTHI